MSALDDSNDGLPVERSAPQDAENARLIRHIYADLKTVQRELSEVRRRLFEGFPGAPPELEVIRGKIDAKADRKEVEGIAADLKEVANSHRRVLAILTAGWLVAQLLVQVFGTKIINPQPAPAPTVYTAPQTVQHP